MGSGDESKKPIPLPTSPLKGEEQTHCDRINNSKPDIFILFFRDTRRKALHFGCKLETTLRSVFHLPNINGFQHGAIWWN